MKRAPLFRLIYSSEPNIAHNFLPKVSQHSPNIIPAAIDGIIIKSPPAANVENDPMNAPGTNDIIPIFPPAHIRNVVTNVNTRPI